MAPFSWELKNLLNLIFYGKLSYGSYFSKKLPFFTILIGYIMQPKLSLESPIWEL